MLTKRDLRKYNGGMVEIFLEDTYLFQGMIKEIELGQMTLLIVCFCESMKISNTPDRKSANVWLPYSQSDWSLSLMGLRIFHTEEALHMFPFLPALEEVTLYKPKQPA